MSKPWRIILAVGIVVIIIGLCLGGLAGLGFNQMRNFAAVNRAAVDMSNPPGTGRFSRLEGRDRFNKDTPRQLEVQLIDDDEDGIPDRGVVDLPAGRGFAPGHGFGHRPGRGFEHDAARNRFPGNRFGPFVLLGALFRLAVLGAVIVGAVVLGLVLYHRWRPAPPAAVSPEYPAPPPPAPEAGVGPISEEPPEAAEPEPPDEPAPPAGRAGDDLEDESPPGPAADAPKS